VEFRAASFLYFAYGSNMLTERLKERTPSDVPVAVGYIEGYQLGFDKVSGDGSGKCDIRSTGKDVDRVHGVLFRIDTDHMDRLDEAEGLGRGYRNAGTVGSSLPVSSRLDYSTQILPTGGNTPGYLD
jgi:Gamma-glutamyl cyclotransferase, AIG2-like